ncbi:AAA family ATPase [Candidatus Kuenenbacteria bacterium]|nr:AAA family ATPase [Candidatus Kuenenbacteria bacterium]
MYLKKLEINGFKSFAQKTTLEFSHGITAIVGPNGSGKSNVSDAIRWVMGEQSIKTLRGKKSEDVIFSGSDKKARLGLAEVSLDLDNSDKKVPIDYSDLLITRKIYRNGESEYLINNSKSKLADINLLLTQANFGHRTYAIIGQGMIDNFLIATPEERKEFFEEATGVKQYQIKKNQTISKLQQVGQNLSAAQIKIQEMEPHLNLLTRQVKKLNKRKEIEAELREAQLNYYSAYWQEINSNYDTEIKKINLIEEEKNKIHELWQSAKDELDKILKNNNTNEKIEKLRQEHQSLLDKKMSLKEELFILKNSQMAKNNSQPSAKNLSEEKINQIFQHLETIDRLHQDTEKEFQTGQNIDTIQKLVFSAKEKITALLSLLRPYLQKTTPEPEKNNTSPKITSLEEKIKSLEAEASSLQSNIKKILDEENSDRSNLWHLQQNYQKHQNELNIKNNELNEIKINLARIETKRFDLKEEILRELGGFDLLKKDAPKIENLEEKNSILNKINKLKGQLEMIGGLDPEIEKEYTETQKQYEFITTQISDLRETMESLKKIINELDQIIKKQMTESFAEINNYFQKYFKMLFNGGKAELSLLKESTEKEQEENQPNENTAINFFQEKNRDGYSGIEIYATPPGKKLKSISILSGGERALTSIALICAIISSNPAPFIVLDEVDAALDESNSLRFAQILEDLSHKTQFIVITHNRATMEKARLLYGVTMGDDGISKLISIKLEESEKYARNSK